MKRRETSNPLSTQVRQILEHSPEVAQSGLGSDFLGRIEHFADVLHLWGARTNLTAHPGDPVEVAFHIVDSLAPLALNLCPASLREGARVLDLGSGAGFPGLILAAAVAGDFTLAETRRRRAAFLSMAAVAMGLTNVRVRVGRLSAETVDSEFDAITARAVGEAGLEIIERALGAQGHAILWVGPEQTFSVGRIRNAGLGNLVRHDYVVRRGAKAVRRSLLTVQKKSV
ncbi:MAG: class I SAM-dependent methyltransferase [Deltaproteobacteria bacterium]|nr:class I SAM-dependent methyltransferase [Deltaproteobacteria bacterium]